MKKIIISLLFFSFIWAKPHLFTNFQQGLDYSIKTNKPIALFLVSSTCPHCRDLVNKIANNRQFALYVGNNFSWIVIDVATQPAPVPFDRSVPTIMVLNQNKEPLSQPVKGDIPLNMLFKYLKENYKLYYNAISSQF